MRTAGDKICIGGAIGALVGLVAIVGNFLGRHPEIAMAVFWWAVGIALLLLMVLGALVPVMVVRILWRLRRIDDHLKRLAGGD